MKKFTTYILETNDNYDDKVVIHGINIIGGGHTWQIPIDELSDWLKTSYKDDRDYLGKLYLYIPEKYVNKEYQQYLETWFDKKHMPNINEYSYNLYFFGDAKVNPTKKYICLKGSSLDDMTNDNCSIYFQRKENKGFKLSEIIKQ